MKLDPKKDQKQPQTMEPDVAGATSLCAQKNEETAGDMCCPEISLHLEN